jgi:hypothetical protein
MGGAVILPTGSAAASLGTWYLSATNAVEAGVGWVAGAIILTEVAEPSEHDTVRSWLEEEPKGYALALAEHTLVALGPDGDIEVWGDAEPVIVLGPGWSEG